MTDYNVYYSQNDIIFVKGDSLALSYTVQKYDTVTEKWEDYDMSGMQLDIKFKREDGLLIKSLSSAGVSPKISITGAIYTVWGSGFDEELFMNYDVQLTNGTVISTIQRGRAEVKKEITT